MALGAALEPPARSGVRLGFLALVGVFLGLVYLGYKMTHGSSPAGAIFGPQTLVSEKLALKEGEAMGYGLVVGNNRKVDVQVDASPKAVNVMLMSEEQWTKYNQVRGQLFGGHHQYFQALSREQVLSMHQDAVLPSGAWRIVVERPRESVIFTEDTAVTIKILGY